MFLTLESWLLIIVTVLHLVGLGSTAAARWNACAPCGLRRSIYFSCLTAVGAFALFALLGGSGLWLPSSATFSMMVVGATFDTTASIAV